MSALLKRTLIAALTALSLTHVAPAKAGDIQGDAYSCKELWVMRNQFYKDRGYCFKTSKAIAYFGNAGCSIVEQANVPLSNMQWQIIHDIKMSEARQGC